MPKFAHIRFKNPDGTVTCKGGITIAFDVVDSITDPHQYKYAMAFCHEQDNYNKKIGRAKAAGRLISARYRQSTFADSTSDLISQILENIPIRWVHINQGESQ